MAQGFGRVVLTTSGTPVCITADGAPEWKAGGVTIDWSTVAAVNSDTTIAIELTVVKNGLKFLRYGQLLVKIDNRRTQVVTINGTPAGGTFVLFGTRPDTQYSGVTVAIAYNATAATVQTALEAIYGAGNVSVTGSAGGPYTVTLQGSLYGEGFPTLGASGVLLTGGTSPSVTVADGNAGANNGWYGPFDSAASDGRQTLSRGNCGLLNETILESGLVIGLPTGVTQYTGLITGGMVFKDRLLATSGSHSLAAGPTFTELEAALPRLRYAGN